MGELGLIGAWRHVGEEKQHVAFPNLGEGRFFRAHHGHADRSRLDGHIAALLPSVLCRDFGAIPALALYCGERS